MVTTRASPPWFSYEIHVAKRAKRAAERRWRNTCLTVRKEKCLNARTHCRGLPDVAKTIHGVMNDILPRIKECKIPTHTHMFFFISWWFCFFLQIQVQLPAVLDSLVLSLLLALRRGQVLIQSLMKKSTGSLLSHQQKVVTSTRGWSKEPLRKLWHFSEILWMVQCEPEHCKRQS